MLSIHLDAIVNDVGAAPLYSATALMHRFLYQEAGLCSSITTQYQSLGILSTFAKNC